MLGGLISAAVLELNAGVLAEGEKIGQEETVG